MQKFRNLNKLLGIVLGFFVAFVNLVNNGVLAKGDVTEIFSSDIDIIADSATYNERIIDLGSLDQYSHMDDLLQNISSRLGFECFCGLDCFQEHLCSYKKKGQDTLTMILRLNSLNGSSKFAKSVLQLFREIVECPSQSNLRFCYTAE